MFYLSGNFKLQYRKDNEFGFLSFGAIIMELDVDRSSSDSHPWSLSRVIGRTLDPGKNWYVVTKGLCGLRPKEFAKSEVFRHFPDEIQTVAPNDLKPATRGCDFNRQPSHLFVVSSFGLCAGLLRQREFANDGLIRSSKFAPVVEAVNRIVLDRESPCSFGGKTDELDHSAQQMELLKSRIAELESQIKELEQNNALNSFLPFSSPLATSSPSHSSSNASTSSCSDSSSASSFIEETLNGPLGHITKKRRVAGQCKKFIIDLDGVCEKYHETLAGVLGNSFVYGAEEERVRVSETISEIVNLVMDAKGSRKGLSELLLPQTYQRILESLRVPDWVLLYFKLQVRLPDAAWQTLLNLTQLGRSGVGYVSLA